jgi:hypothetical protein
VRCKICIVKSHWEFKSLVPKLDGLNKHSGQKKCMHTLLWSTKWVSFCQIPIPNMQKIRGFTHLQAWIYFKTNSQCIKGYHNEKIHVICYCLSYFEIWEANDWLGKHEVCMNFWKLTKHQRSIGLIPIDGKRQIACTMWSWLQLEMWFKSLVFFIHLW